MNPALASIKQTFGQALKTAREQRKVSIADQCRALNVSRAVYEEWENDIAVPDSGQVRRILAWDRGLTRYKDELRQRRAAAGGPPEFDVEETPPTGTTSLFKTLQKQIRRRCAAQIDPVALRVALGVPDDARLFITCPGVGDMPLGDGDVELHVSWEEVVEEP